MIWLASHFNQSCVSMTSIFIRLVAFPADGINGDAPMQGITSDMSTSRNRFRNEGLQEPECHLMRHGSKLWFLRMEGLQAPISFDPATTWHANDCEYEKTPWPQAMRLVRT